MVYWNMYTCKKWSMDSMGLKINWCSYGFNICVFKSLLTAIEYMCRYYMKWIKPFKRNDHLCILFQQINLRGIKSTKHCIQSCSNNFKHSVEGSYGIIAPMDYIFPVMHGAKGTVDASVWIHLPSHVLNGEYWWSCFGSDKNVISRL